jgi:drug/metabolite transporter (DMT)-like permease
MSQFVLFVVLAAALLDALQHCLIKGSNNQFTMSLLVAVTGGLVALPVLAATGLPDAASWPWLACSVIVSCLYWALLGWAYTSGSLAMVFPISRGVAVLLTTLGATYLLRETLSPIETLTVFVVIGGLCVIAANGANQKVSLHTLLPSLALGVTISAFTLLDATGVRLSGSAAAYTSLLYIGNALGVGAYAALFERRRLAEFGPSLVMPALRTAGLSMFTYFLIMYAMVHAPTALVAALVETSIVFAALFGVVWLREPARFGHLAGVAVVASGVAFLRLIH